MMDSIHDSETLQDNSNWTSEYNSSATDNMELDFSGFLSQDGHVLFRPGNLDVDKQEAIFPKTIYCR